MKQILNYINGELVPPVSGEWIDNIDPAIGEVYSHIPRSNQQDAEKAIAAAKSAFGEWDAMGEQGRSKVMLRVADLLEENMESFARAESVDNGKPIQLARSVDIPRAVSNIRFYATAILHDFTETHHTGHAALNYTLRQPIGVAGCISPWNLPLYLFTWKIAPALASGNTVVAKPSEITPMTAYMLSKICIQAGMPSGVLNIIHGYGHEVGQAIIEHQDVPIISFTGGTVTGKKIAAIAAPMFKKLSLELGGKNPNIIFDDCDFDQMLATTMRSSFANQGQICLCGSRILVQEGIYEKFKKAFVEKVKKMKVGDPLDESTRTGAVVSKPHQEKVLSYIELAKQEGGSVLAGGHSVQLDGRCAQGHFIQPTVIEGLDMTCRTNQEEIFGPVVTIMPFKTEEEALLLANATQYGLAATVWTQNLNRAHRLAAKVESGIVWINCWLFRDLRTPFGGVKQSGVGREGGFEALKFFTEPKNVCIKL